MASDSILRLKVDSKEYDSKLKSATDALSRYWDALGKGKNTLGSTQAELLKYVQALGSMETRSTTVRGRISELSKAYIELQHRYSQMSDSMKTSDVGRAMAISMDQLRERTIAAKKELNDLGRAIGNLPSGTKEVGGLGVEKFASGLNGLNSLLSGGMDSLTAMIGKAGPYGAAAAGVIGLGTAFASMGKEAIAARQTLENLELNIGTLLGSAEKGRALVKELQAYGVKTPYDTEGLASAARTMLAYGVSAGKIMAIMRQLGDVAQGNTNNLQSLALAFGQMTAVGTVQKQDLNQMANAGFGFNQIAKSMHVSVAEFLDMVSKKKVSVDDIAKALQDATSAGGLFYNSAVNASTGLEGTFSNFEESMTVVKAKIGALIEPAVIEVVNSLGEAIEQLTAGLGGSAEAAKTFKSIGEGLGLVIKGVTIYIQKIIAVGSDFAKVFTEIGSAANGLISAIGDVTNSIIGASGLQKAFDAGNSSILVKAIIDLFIPIERLHDRLKATLGLIKAAKHAISGNPTKLPRTYSEYHGYDGDRVRLSLSMAAKNGNAKWNAQRGEYTDNQGNWIGRIGRSKSGKLMRREYDVINGRFYWQYIKSNQQKTEPETSYTPKTKGKKKKGKTGHTETAADRAAEARNYYGQVTQEVNKLADTMVQTTTANEIAAMNDGSEKRKKTIEANRQKELDALDRQLSDIAKKEADADKKAWLKTNPKKGVADYNRTDNGRRTADDWKEVVMQMKTADGTLGDIYSKARKSINVKYDAQLGNITEQQDNTSQIEANSQKYMQLMAQREQLASKANKTEADTSAIAAIDAQAAALIKQNSQLRQRNDLLAQWKQQAQGQRDFSHFSQTNVSAFISDTQTRLANADFGSTIYNSLTSQLRDATAFSTLIQDAVKAGLDPSQYAGLWQQILAGKAVDDALNAMVDKINTKRQEMGQSPVMIDQQTGQVSDVTTTSPLSTIQSGWQDLEGIGGGIQSITQALSDNANAWQTLTGVINGFFQTINGITQVIELVNKLTSSTKAQTVAIGLQSAAKKADTATTTSHTVATIADTAASKSKTVANSGEAVSEAAKQGAKVPFPGNLAAIAAGVAAVVAALALIKSFANGGIVHAATGSTVPGNHFSGDLVPAMVNSGELILNRAQQGNLAAQLDSQQRDIAAAQPYIDGETIYLGLSNFARRSGMGELVFSR